MEEDLVEKLAENFFIILLAYVAAFLPWTAVSSTDFISPIWRTVQETRRAGVTNLLFTAVPALYILFYIVLQSSLPDYKEMFAAIVALLFSILHITRTCWGLWQLRIFRRWAARSIRALNHLHIPYHPRKSKYVTPEAIAEHLLVNDELIDNQLFHGHARCYLHYSGTNFTYDPKRGGRLFQRLFLLPKFVFVVFRYLFDRIRSTLFLKRPPPLKQIPHYPIDVWVRWSVAFAAQGLSEWIRDFAVAEDPDLKGHSSNKQLYEMRRAYFAGQVLAGAGMQLWPSGEFPLTKEGHVSKRDLFWPAVLSGTGLPFDAPQTDVLKDNVGDLDSFSRSAYRPYARALLRIVESMPVKFGKDIENFDVEKLEWLAILLHLGNQIMEQVGELDQSEESYTSSSTSDSSTTTVVDDDQTEVFAEETEDELEDGDLALDNLRTQLGFGPEDKAPTDPDKGIASFSAVPLEHLCFQALSGGNRLVTKVGELIDCWSALVSGDQIKFMLTMDPRWSQKCLGGESGDLPLPLHSPRTGRRIRRTNESLRSSHSRVEKARLAYQFAAKRNPYWHMDQTITFMGHSLETVRTCLAQYVRKIEEAPPDLQPRMKAWNPQIFAKDERMTEWLEVGEINELFSKGMAKAPSINYFRNRGVQMRLLWELQLILGDKFYGEAVSPTKMQLVMLCMLGFPSLSIEVEKDNDFLEASERTVSAQQGKQSLSLFFAKCSCPTKENVSKDDLQAWLVTIRPVCGPQDLGICAKFVPSSEDSYTLSMRLFRGSSARDDAFQWEWWRDASMSRLEGFREWQKAHDMRTINLYPTHGSLDRSTRELQVILKGTGKSFITWCGWEPFRFEQCRFELESPGFLLHFESYKTLNFMTGESEDDARKHRLPRVKRRPLSYEESEREQLRHSCFVIREVIPDYGKSEEEGMDATLSRSQRAKRLIEEAQSLRVQGPENFDRAVLLLEVASVELGSINALRECVMLLTDPTATTKDPKRAARLIEYCLASELKRKHGNNVRLTQAHEEFGSDAFHTLFAELVVRGGFAKETVIPFCNYLGVVISVDQGTSIARCFCWFRRMFLYSRRYEVLEIMASTMRSARVADSCDADIDLSDDLCAHFDGFVTMRLVDKERKKSINILSKAFYERAQNDVLSTTAMNELGLLLQHGAEGIESDPLRSKELFERAIEFKSVYAMNNLGSLLLHGADGIPRDPVRAKALFERAIKKGRLVGAMYNLAVLLRDGADGVEKDTARVVDLFTRAIRRGRHVKAMYELGMIYEHGMDEVQKDLVKSIQLYEMAVQDGESSEANDRLVAMLGFRKTMKPDAMRTSLSYLLDSPTSD